MKTSWIAYIGGSFWGIAFCLDVIDYYFMGGDAYDKSSLILCLLSLVLGILLDGSND